MKNIFLDNQVSALRQERANEYFQEAARPFFKQMADIRSLYAKVVIVVSKEGEIVSHKSILPDFAEKWIKTCEESVEMCRVLAFNEAMNYYP